MEGGLAAVWDFDRMFVSMGGADQAWTIDDKFTGTRAIVDARFTIHRKMLEAQKTEDCCPPPSPAQRLIGVLDGDFQFGDSDTDMEYLILAATPLGYQRNTELKGKKFMVTRDTLEFGRFLYSYDDPLGVDYNTEFHLARGGRTWGYKLSDESPWSVTLGIKVSLGWAWASSIAPQYQDVSNPILGGWFLLNLNHERWGKLYTDQRLVEGFQFRSPSVKEPSSREAVVRAGYIKRFSSGWIIDLFAEKRSFTFEVSTLPTLYTKGRRLGGSIGFQWK